MQVLIKLFSTLSYKALCTLRIELFLLKKKPTKSSLNSAFLLLIIKLTKERQCFLCDRKFSYSFLSLKYLQYFIHLCMIILPCTVMRQDIWHHSIFSVWTVLQAMRYGHRQATSVMPPVIHTVRWIYRTRN